VAEGEGDVGGLSSAAIRARGVLEGVRDGSDTVHHRGTEATEDLRTRRHEGHEGLLCPGSIGAHNILLLFFFVSFVLFVPSW